MAEAILSHLASERFEACSAGLTPGHVHPLTHRVLEEIGIDSKQLYAKGVNVFLGRVAIHYAIVLCEKAQEHCPRIYPFALENMYWPFDDPVVLGQTEEDRLLAFRRVRDEIGERLQVWLSGRVQPA